MSFFKKRFVWGITYTITIITFTAFALLDTFVIPHAVSSVSDSASLFTSSQTKEEDSSASSSSTSAFSSSDTDSSLTPETPKTESNETRPTVTETSYKDDNISITIDEIVKYDTKIYIADIVLSSVDYLKTAMAQDTYGRNITEATSSISARKGAVLAINGDFYGADSRGYVIKNGVLYRDTVRADSGYDDLVIYSDGSAGIINETEISAEELISSGVTQLLAFGPALVENGSVCVSENDEVGKSMSSNPRTAIGIIDSLHYVFVVSDGRTSESNGLSLYQLAGITESLGCKTAYNLDGGGSSTMYFNGSVINNPTTNGKSIKERAVSDIVYIG